MMASSPINCDVDFYSLRLVGKSAVALRFLHLATGAAVENPAPARPSIHCETMHHRSRDQTSRRHEPWAADGT